VRGCSARWKEIANEIPVPRFATLARAWILERFVLQASKGKTHRASIFDQALAIGGDQVRHGATLPDMAMEPQAAIHRVDHPLSATRELAVGSIIERAVAIDRSAAHSRATAMSGSVAGDSPLEGCRR
jgi:hypothetical protein